jgi:predicted metal-dependent HD superfamily phosphohydrolase
MGGMAEQTVRWQNNDHLHATMHEAFTTLWSRCTTTDPEIGRALADRLVDAYTEPHRRYHSLGHIDHCLEELRRARPLIAEPERLELAIWFHDAVYVPGARDNEEQSAALFERCCRPYLAPDVVADVARLIRVTTHREPPVAEDERYVVDIDLSSFALPWDRFSVDSKHVREEQWRVGDDDYRTAHGAFLRGLVARPSIFSTEFFHRRCEEPARRNIARWLDRLCTAGGE